MNVRRTAIHWPHTDTYIPTSPLKFEIKTGLRWFGRRCRVLHMLCFEQELFYGWNAQSSGEWTSISSEKGWIQVDQNCKDFRGLWVVRYALTAYAPNWLRDGGRHKPPGHVVGIIPTSHSRLRIWSYGSVFVLTRWEYIAFTDGSFFNLGNPNAKMHLQNIMHAWTIGGSYVFIAI